VRKTFAGLALAVAAGLFLTSAPAQSNETAANRPAAETSTCPRAGVVWWSELLAPETERLTEFYAKVMGWNTKIVDAEDQAQPARSPEDRYTVFMDGDHEVAGLMRANHPEAVHSVVGWFTYIQVADVDAAAAKARTAGGTIMRPPVETADGNRIAVISDPMGNVFGLVTPARAGRC
jgi:predicted enzyme related to lactoylglutathione lyase